jgi:hypothetical protein
VSDHRCPDCGVEPGNRHLSGCDVERCALCGGQMLGGCICVYPLNGIKYSTLEETHPDIYARGPTEDMWTVYDAKVATVGGPVIWAGVWPGEAECVEWGWYSFWDETAPYGKQWVRCDAEHPKAGPDLNRLHDDARWSVELRRWVKR